MSFVENRIGEIGQRYAHLMQDMLVLSLTDETFRLVLLLNDGTTLRVMERWHEETLVRYSFYWLDAQNELKVGWDNAPHHSHLANYPHHKHIAQQSVRVASCETCLDDVMTILASEITSYRS